MTILKCFTSVYVCELSLPIQLSKDVDVACSQITERFPGQRREHFYDALTREIFLSVENESIHSKMLISTATLTEYIVV